MKAKAPMRFVKSDVITGTFPTEIIQQTDALHGIMEFIEQLLPDRTVIVCMRSQSPSVQYVTKNCKQLFGLDACEIYAMKLDEFLKIVHPDDIGKVQQCFAFINDMEPYDPLDYRFTLHYRVRHQKGHYLHVTDEKIAIKRPTGNYVYLNSFENVTAKEKFHDVKMAVHQRIRDVFRHVHTYIPRLVNADFTPRQKDIVNLMSKGFSNAEIADRLSVSVNTIKNHKMLLFKKVNVRNAVELLGSLQTLR